MLYMKNLRQMRSCTPVDSPALSHTMWYAHLTIYDPTYDWNDLAELNFDNIPNVKNIGQEYF